jgi:hypothetical protein
LGYAELQVREGEPEPAVGLLRRAMKLRPRNPDALAALAATGLFSELRPLTLSGCIARSSNGNQGTR